MLVDVICWATVAVILSVLINETVRVMRCRVSRLRQHEVSSFNIENGLTENSQILHGHLDRHPLQPC